MGDDLLMSLRALLRAGPGPVDLSSLDPRGTPGLPPNPDRKNWARAELARVGARLAADQERLYASAKADPAQRRRVLLVLQAMDCGGKDGTIKNVGGTLNPLGLWLASFGPPTKEESAHHFLWRIRRALPPPGYVGVFNRSHYEDVLIARVRKLVPRKVWRARYEEINGFERELVDGGVALVKVMLHISPEEQRERLLRRLGDPTKHWKFNPADVAERARWADYQEAYAAAIERCGPDHAPWYVVPADRKWYRDWAVATLLQETMADLRLAFPPAAFDVTTERRRLLTADQLKMNKK